MDAATPANYRNDLFQPTRSKSKAQQRSDAKRSRKAPRAALPKALTRAAAQFDLDAQAQT